MQSGFRILIVEDDPDARFLIQRIIGKDHPTAAVSEASDGQAGLQQFVDHGADLLIIDQRIPRLNGLDLAREIRSRDAGVPIILISSTPSVQMDPFGAGINHFVDKANLLRDLPLFLTQLAGKAA